MRVTVQPVNPAFKEYVLRYAAEVEEPRYTFVGTEAYGTYVFDCTADNPWIAVGGLQAALRRPPIGNAIFCHVKPYGMPTWPPLFDKDKYPRP